MTDATPPSDLFPNLDEAFVRRVHDRLTKRFGKEAPYIAWECWVKLKPCLADYKHRAEYVRGFLNKGEATVLRDISKRSRALLDALSRASDAGVGKPVDAALEPVTLAALEDVLRNLEENFRLDGEIAPNLEDTSRANLFADFEAWWKRSTGLSASIEEGSAGDTWPTPFMLVANEVFTLSGMPPPTGSSYKSLKDFRRANRAVEAKRKRFAADLGRLQTKPDGSGG